MLFKGCGVAIHCASSVAGCFHFYSIMCLCFHWVVQNTKQHPFLIHAGSRQKKSHGWNLRLKRLKCGWKYFNRYFNRISTASTVILCFMPAGNHVMTYNQDIYAFTHYGSCSFFQISHLLLSIFIITMKSYHANLMVFKTGCHWQFSSLELDSLMIMTHSSQTTGPTT